MGPLADSSIAVLLFNRGEEASTISAKWETLGLDPTGTYNVRDLWKQTDVSRLNAVGGITAVLPSHGSSFFKVSVAPPQIALRGVKRIAMM